MTVDVWRSPADVARADRDTVLRVLCAGARTVSGAATAYVAMNSMSTAEAVVCAADGLRTEAMRALRLPHRTGLGGAVAHDGVARSTGDYRHDSGFDHSDHLDRCVGAEGLRSIVAVPLRHGASILGTVLAGVRAARPFDDGQRAALQALADVAAAAVRNIGDAAAAHRRADLLRARCDELERTVSGLAAQGPDGPSAGVSRLLADAVCGRCSEQDYRARARVCGQDPVAGFHVLAVGPPHGVVATARHAVERAGGGLDYVGTDLVAVLPANVHSADSAVALVRSGLGPAHATIGTAGPAVGVAGLRAAAAAAVRVVQLLEAVGACGGAAAADQLGPLVLLVAGAGAAEVAEFVRRALAPLAAVGPAQRVRLMETLDIYCRHDGSVTAAARALGLHANSVYARIAQLDSILGPGWRGGGRRAELETAIRIYRAGTPRSHAHLLGEGSTIERPTMPRSRSVR